ncbi:MAG: ArsR family transcriptional regulator [Candidatus Nomurabacteria bacterium]|nr:ArsR family transcriptional regulator [Candidatus Nomurabacteria bacterium]
MGKITKKTEDLCPDCFKVVSVPSRYKMVYILAKEKEGLTVQQITNLMLLKQPTITHHLNILRSVNAVFSQDRGRERIYTINRGAHCFEECNIPFD